ncbi:MAG: hypothetical protein WC331_10045 [Candidatus Omnitrophota bacterium]|jgi:hypothetical protein
MNRRLIKAVLGLNTTYYLTPATTGVPAVGTVVTTGAGAWGAYADLVAAGAITTEFWLCGFYTDTAGAAQVFEVQVRNATPATLTEFRIDPTAVTVNLGYLPVGPFPINMAGSSQVQARAGGAAAKVLGVSTLISVTI